MIIKSESNNIVHHFKAISINNEFLNQRENIMSISLDLMKRQMQEMQGSLLKEIEKMHSENRRLVETIHQMNSAKVADENSGVLNNRKVSLLEKEIHMCKQELMNTETNCQKILKLDQTRLDNVKSKFDEIKKTMDCQNNLIESVKSASDKEHLDVLRKMYQETTHKLMIFRNALKERQHIRQTPNTELRVSNKPFTAGYSSSPSHFQPSSRSASNPQLYQTISPSSSSSSASSYTPSPTNRSPPMESAKAPTTSSITVTPIGTRHLLNQMNQMNLNELDLIVEEEPAHLESQHQSDQRAQKIYNSIANAKPVKSSTPTLAMQSQSLQIAANQISTQATSGDDDQVAEWSSQQNIEDILYNSDETLSDYDDDDDDDFENELEYDVDENEDLDEQDRRMLEYTEPGRRGREDVASVSTNSREILIERESNESKQQHCHQPDRPLNW